MKSFSELTSLVAAGMWNELLSEIEQHPDVLNLRDTFGATLLMRVCGTAGSLSVVRELIRFGANVNEATPSGESALGNALSGGSTFGLTTLDIVEDLCNAGVSLSAPINAGYPPLHWCIANNRLEHARLLLRYGADPNQKTFDLQPETALEVARRVGNRSALKLLSEHE